MSLQLIDYGGREVDGDVVVNQHLNGGKSHVVTADMDGTMYDRDIGVLVFLEKLSDPSFWNLEVEFFDKLLLPKKYRGALINGEKGDFPGLDPNKCKLALELANDSVKLYAFQQKLHPDPGKDSSMKKQISVEFARKMLELDKILLAMDAVLHKKFGELLMRTRFFAGKSPQQIEKLTQRVMEVTATSADRIVDLPISGQLGPDAQQEVTEEMIADLYGKKSDLQKLDRLVAPIAEVQKFLRALIQQNNFPGLVVTANLVGIAKTAIGNSDYRFLREQRHLNGRGRLVAGTRLRSDTDKGTLAPQVDGFPIFGPRKAEVARKFAEERNGLLGVAIGDSPNTDGPMLQEALKQGGIAVVVGKDTEEVRRRFHPVFAGLIEECRSAAKRIFHIVHQ